MLKKKLMNMEDSHTLKYQPYCMSYIRGRYNGACNIIFKDNQVTLAQKHLMVNDKPFNKKKAGTYLF